MRLAGDRAGLLFVRAGAISTKLAVLYCLALIGQPAGGLSEPSVGHASAEPNLAGYLENPGRIKGVHGRDEPRQEGAAGRHATAAMGLLRHCIVNDGRRDRNHPANPPLPLSCSASMPAATS
jgi:hypothetical protein